jgi:hypothetical protein
MVNVVNRVNDLEEVWEIGGKRVENAQSNGKMGYSDGLKAMLCLQSHCPGKKFFRKNKR